MASDFTFAQAAPPGGELATLYTVPPGKKAVVSTVLACNQTEDPRRLTITAERPPLFSLAAEQSYLYRARRMPGLETFAATIGATLPAGCSIRVGSDGGGVSFTAFANEVDA